MEFFCVLSVDGSLASYHLQQTGEAMFKATLPTANNRTDILAEIMLRKEADGWYAQPHHDVIVPGLVHAIEAADY